MPNYQTMLADDSRFRVLYEDLDINSTTFKGKLQVPIQSWFRLTPSFSPHLVQTMLDSMKVTSSDKVLDPFMGTGTTLIHCKLHGIDSVGVEINPVFYEVAKISTHWDYDLVELEKSVHQYLKRVELQSKKVKEIPLKLFPSRLGIALPKIYNLNRWWREDVLKNLLVARNILKQQDLSPEIGQFLRVGLMCILVEVANIARKHPTLTFVDRSADEIDAIETLSSQLYNMLKDIKGVQKVKSKAKTKVLLGDSTKISSLLNKNEINSVITSPPYPNRISYVWETRPHLYFFEIFHKPIEAGLLDCKTIGGTWGRATSILQNGEIKPRCDVVEKVVGPISNEIRVRNPEDSRANLMANYVMKYFNMMHKHLEELCSVVTAKLQCAYVVGNSRIKGVDVPTDIILGEIFESLSLRVKKIVRTRKRIGRKNIYEAIVFSSKV